MPSTRRQKAKARRSREMDLFFDFDNMEVVLDDKNSNPIVRELANTISGSVSHNDTEAPTIEEIHQKKAKLGILMLEKKSPDLID